MACFSDDASEALSPWNCVVSSSTTSKNSSLRDRHYLHLDVKRGLQCSEIAGDLRGAQIISFRHLFHEQVEMSTRNIVLVDGIILLRKMLETIAFKDSYNRNQLIVEVKRL